MSPSSPRCPTTGTGRSPWSPTPTTWSTARRRPSPAGPMPASPSPTSWSPGARPGSTGWNRQHRPHCAPTSNRPRCDAVGVTALEFLDHPDGIIEYSTGAAARHRRRDPPAPTRAGDHPQSPRALRRRGLQHGRSPGGRPGDDRRRTRRGQPLAVRRCRRAVERGAVGGGVGFAGTHPCRRHHRHDRPWRRLVGRPRRVPGRPRRRPMADPDAFLRGIAQHTAPAFGGRLATTFELIAM